MPRISHETAEAASAWFSALRPPPRLSLSDWAERNARLYSGAVFKPYPYQRAILDAMNDPKVDRISVMKSARVGYSQMLSAAIAYHIALRPSQIMVVQPTTEDAEDYSKDTLEPMNDWPILAGLLADIGAKKAANTIKRKSFPGGSLKVAGANSPRAFRRIDLDLILFDEIDGYPNSAGEDGDQIALGMKRTVQSLHPLAVMGSTPLVAGQSKIEAAFLAGTGERFHVPCPHCGTYQALRWGDGTGAGLRWDDDDPDGAYYVCNSGCIIDESSKTGMLSAGKWVAERPFRGHRSFHIWSGYSLLPGARWGKLAAEFLEAKGDPDRLRTFVNTTLGECWRDRGEAPDWRRIYDRRELWEPGTVPAGGLFLTAGADVQRDRLEVSIWAWGRGKASWLVEHEVLMGDAACETPWRLLTAMLNRSYRHENGAHLAVEMCAVDAGDGNSMEHVKNWARTAGPKVMAVKGSSQSLAPILGSPADTDVVWNGKRLSRGVKLWPVGVSSAKSELYGWLRQIMPTKESGSPEPVGYVHIPHFVGEEYCKQLVSEHRVTEGGKGKPKTTSWKKLRERNEALDCRVYARAAACRHGIDRISDADWDALEALVTVAKDVSPTLLSRKSVKSGFVHDF